MAKAEGKLRVADFPRPPAIEREHRRVTVTLGGVLIADTTDAWRVQDREAVAAARQAWWTGADGVGGIGPERLVSLDECGVLTTVPRPHGRSPRGTRACTSAPFGRRTRGNRARRARHGRHRGRDERGSRNSAFTSARPGSIGLRPGE